MRAGAQVKARVRARARARARAWARARAQVRSGWCGGGARRGGGGAERGLLSPRKPLVGREELRRTQPGTARCVAERSGGAAGGC